jgi:hypothetical protein
MEVKYPPELPFHAMRPAMGLIKSLLITPLYPPAAKLPPASRMSTYGPPLMLISRTAPSNVASVSVLSRKLSKPPVAEIT